MLDHVLLSTVFLAKCNICFYQAQPLLVHVMQLKCCTIHRMTVWFDVLMC
uniref:Uncharacterized protein n=1 Tax=Triticum urartu TaxID=4572 RepID=A0A8R7P459_TRIUA